MSWSAVLAGCSASWAAGRGRRSAEGRLARDGASGHRRSSSRCEAALLRNRALLVPLSAALFSCFWAGAKGM